MAKSVFLLCLTALLCGVTLARVGRQEITRDQPGFNSVAGRGAPSAVADELHRLIAGQGHWRHGGIRGKEGGAGQHERGGPIEHRRRFGGSSYRQLMHQVARSRMPGGARGDEWRWLDQGLRRGSHSFLEGAGRQAGRVDRHRALEHLRAEIHRQHQEGHGFRRQGHHGSPGIGRFDADAFHHPHTTGEQMSRRQQHHGVRGHHLDWIDFAAGHGLPRVGPHGYRAMHRMMDHDVAGDFMGGHPGRGDFGRAPRFAAP